MSTHTHTHTQTTALRPSLWLGLVAILVCYTHTEMAKPRWQYTSLRLYIQWVSRSTATG